MSQLDELGAQPREVFYETCGRTFRLRIDVTKGGFTRIYDLNHPEEPPVTGHSTGDALRLFTRRKRELYEK